MLHVMAALAALMRRKDVIPGTIALIASIAAILLGAGIVPLVSSDHAAAAKARLVRKTIPVQAVCGAPDAGGLQC